MVVFPNCKINLGLNIIEKRGDGFHNLESIFLPISYADVLEVLPARNGCTSFTLKTTGHKIFGDYRQNIVFKAYDILKKNYSEQVKPVEVHLHKVLPNGAGIGGGSSDGTSMLACLNNLFDLALTTEELASFALELGSDCPFFVYNTPAFVTGRGEHILPITIGSFLQQATVVLLHPQLHISTKQIFSKITPHKPNLSVLEAIQQPIQSWKDCIKNDFEEVVFSENIGLSALKNMLYNLGADYSSLSGTGSTVYGIFSSNTITETDLANCNFPMACNYKIAKIGSM